MKKAMDDRFDPESAAEYWATVWALVLEGNVEIIKWLGDRVLGKAVSRSESGRAGDFEQRDAELDKIDVDTAKKILKLAEGE